MADEGVGELDVLEALGDEQPVTEETEESVSEEAAESKLDFAARVGSFVLIAPAERRGPELHGQICDALNADPRVTTSGPIATVPPVERRNSWVVFPMVQVVPGESFTLGSSSLLEGSGHEFVPIAFNVSVPTKNQRVVNGPVPSEDYTAVWDGFTLVVAWENPGGDHVETSSGGHVVGDVLTDAAKSCGADLFVQACTPGCEYGFNHTTLLFSVTRAAGEGSEYGDVCFGRQMHVSAPSIAAGDTVENHTIAVYGTLEGAYRDFALMKNRSTHAMVVMSQAFDKAAALLEILRQRADASAGTHREVLKKRIRLWKWRRNARVLIAELWLHVAELESLRQEWHAYRTEFETKAVQAEVLELFASDYETEASNLDRLDLESLRAQADHAAQRLDNRDVVAATSVGALAGGVAGALVSIIG